MLRSLYPGVDWGTVRIVGLDMDGTLYDEADFIAQAYEPIAGILAAATGGDRHLLYSRLLRRWLEKGSSYDRIFREALDDAGVAEERAGDAVRECVEAFRACSPSLTLPARARMILETLHEMFPLFLVSDGSAALQQRKFDSLGLHRWFDPRNVAIAGRHGPDYRKPGIRMLGEIALLRGVTSFDDVVYFGDREIDAQFADKAGFRFIQVACMR